MHLCTDNGCCNFRSENILICTYHFDLLSYTLTTIYKPLDYFEHLEKSTSYSLHISQMSCLLNLFLMCLWFCCFAEYWVICPIKITKFARRVHFSSLSVLDEIKLLMICTWRSGVTQTPWKSLLFNQNALVHHCNWSGIGDHIFWAIRR